MGQSEISISLRIAGDHLDPDDVSRILDCEPAYAKRKGELITGKAGTVQQPTGMWSVKAEPRYSAKSDFDARVLALLERLSPDIDAWTELAREFQVDLFCGVFMASANDGFRIEAETLAELARRKIKLSLDIYSFDSAAQ